jgi:hypothetical protein
MFLPMPSQWCNGKTPLRDAVTEAGFNGEAGKGFPADVAKGKKR